MIYDIKEIKVNGKTFLIVMLQIDSPLREKDRGKFSILNKMYPYINSYVYIKGIGKFENEVLGDPTFKKDNIIGVDTAHSWNESQTKEERVKDSLEQIKYCIKCYLKNLK